MRTFLVLLAGWLAGAAILVALSVGRGGEAHAAPLPVIARTNAAILVPVLGVQAAALRDTYEQARSGGRAHHALDIMAPRGTPVVAAVDGTIRKLFFSRGGGLTIYEFDAREERVYYYAHLDHYQSGLSAGREVHKGDTLGFVGTTGNAPKDVPHLHFQIMLWPADGKYWIGEPVNPYPVLRGAIASGAVRLRFD